MSVRACKRCKTHRESSFLFNSDRSSQWRPMLKAPPCLPTTPTTQPALQLQPVFRRWLVTARTVAAVHVRISHPHQQPFWRLVEAAVLVGHT